MGDDPGSLFPSSWKTSFEIAHGQASGRTPAALSLNGPLHERSDYKSELPVFEHILQSAAPQFDKHTEDGSRFRIYKLGSLEIRTVQEYGGREVIEVVFSMHPPKHLLLEGRREQRLIEQENIVKATLYVEGGLPETRPASGSKAASCDHHMYAVFETGKANMIVTEMAENGTMAWEMNPRNLDVRSSLAKVYSSGTPQGWAPRVHDIQVLRDTEVENSESLGAGSSAAASVVRRQYAKTMYRRALGEAIAHGSRCVG